MLEILHSGDLYDPGDAALMAQQLQCLEKLYDYNATRPTEQARRAALLKEMFAEIGEGCYLEPPLRANWAGRFVHFGKNIYANFGLTLVDDTHIYVGDSTMFGPHVVVATAGHPILPELRERGLQYNAPVRIGRNCWIGAGALIMPGVTIGENTVVGAGSVVTKALPSNVVAVGNPCRVLREINEHDRRYYFRDRQIPAPFSAEQAMGQGEKMAPIRWMRNGNRPEWTIAVSRDLCYDDRAWRVRNDDRQLPYAYLSLRPRRGQRAGLCRGRIVGGAEAPRLFRPYAL